MLLMFNIKSVFFSNISFREMASLHFWLFPRNDLSNIGNTTEENIDWASMLQTFFDKHYIKCKNFCTFMPVQASLSLTKMPNKLEHLSPASLSNLIVYLWIRPGHWHRREHMKMTTFVKAPASLTKFILVWKLLAIEKRVSLIDLFVSEERKEKFNNIDIRGRIFSRGWPFYEWAMSNLDRSMHISLWV